MLKEIIECCINRINLLLWRTSPHMQIMIYRDEGLFTARDNATWRSSLERHFYDDHDRKVNGSTPNLVSLLRPWTRCFTLITSAW